MNQIEQLAREIAVLKRQISSLQAQDPYSRHRVLTGQAISSPPTDAELDGIFGTPATLGAGFLAIIGDNNIPTASYWLVGTTTTLWLYEQLTIAA